MSVLFGEDEKSRAHRNAIYLTVVLCTFGYFALKRNKPSKPGVILQSFFRGYAVYRVRGMELWEHKDGKKRLRLSFQEHKKIKSLLDQLEQGQPTGIPARLSPDFLQLHIKESQGRILKFRFYREGGRNSYLVGLLNRRGELRESVGMLRSVPLWPLVQKWLSPPSRTAPSKKTK